MTALNLLTPDEVARALRTTPAALAKRRARGTGPAWVQDGQRRVLYRVEDIERWLQENTNQP